MYAALAPTPKTSTHLKAACHTWEDHLWAQVSVVCEEKESSELSKLTESFWEGNGLGSGGTLDETEEGEEDEWEREVVNSLESLADVAVEEGYVLLPSQR